MLDDELELEAAYHSDIVLTLTNNLRATFIKLLPFWHKRNAFRRRLSGYPRWAGVGL
jgi:hypothetical protein